jgi:hypothetical protein
MAPQHIKTLCGAGLPVWESLKVTLQLLKFGMVAMAHAGGCGARRIQEDLCKGGTETGDDLALLENWRPKYHAITVSIFSGKQL